MPRMLFIGNVAMMFSLVHLGRTCKSFLEQYTRPAYDWLHGSVALFHSHDFKEIIIRLFASSKLVISTDRRIKTI